LLSADGKLARVRGLSRDAGTGVVMPFVEALRSEIQNTKVPGVEVRVSGGLVIASHALSNIVGDMASSLGVALVAILIFMTLLFRSLRVSLIALLPNAVPVLAALATMVLTGIELRVATALIFSMALGVAVDACVHLLARLREEQRQEAAGDDGLAAALVRTMQGAGRPVVYSTVLLLVGFCVMAFSQFNALRHFALLGGATIAAALAVDLLILPALAHLVKLR
jgi:predicted RND superfamily exporter protein